MAHSSAIFWGIIQGITEFVPISSSGHLVVIPRLLGMEAPGLEFTILLHMGTFVSVLIYFRKDIASLFSSGNNLGLLVLAGTVPIIIAGLLFAESIEAFFSQPRLIGWMLVLNGLILVAAHLKIVNSRAVSFGKYNLLKAVMIGVAQTVALIPGISRSGSTISAGIMSGLDREDAYKFSFLLFLPATILAFLYSLAKMCRNNVSEFNANMLLGGLISAVTGILALKFLYSVLKEARLNILGIYCIALGALTVFIY